MFSTLLMGGGGHAREKDHQNVKSLIIFARDCRGCLYGSEPARVPELARIPEMNFTTRLHETYMKGWLFVFYFFFA